jgi:hypothetical protein
VEERIVYDFGDARRRGIYRDVPVRYGRGLAADYRIALEVLDVQDAGGRARPHRVSREGTSLRIRIGDPRQTTSGVEEYRIRYRVRRGVLWLESHDELYWNVTGNAWDVPIDAVRASVSLPQGRPAGELRATCFTGALGAVESDCSRSQREGAVAFEAGRALAAREGLTLVLALPKGVLEEPGAVARLLERASDWLDFTLLLPLAVLAGGGLLWRRFGRDPSGAVAVPVRYEPPEDMTPAEVGTVLDERVDLRDLTATLLDLAVRGHLEIAELPAKGFLFLSERDYELRHTGADESALKAHERRLLGALFAGRREVHLSSLRNEFYKSLPGIRDALYREVSREGGWFPTRPDQVRTRAVALALGVFGLAAVVALVACESGPAALSFAASGGIAAFFGRHMPRKTLRGRRARQHILGFQEFLERVEGDRLERLGLRTLSQFEKLLPYAFVLGAADAWAEAFADLYTEPPAWYHAQGTGPFRARGFVGDVGRALDTAGATLASHPRSSGSGASGFGGGGFSGGGFGGGGGGSW